MPEFSPGVLLTWQIAALEATNAHFESIEREHLMLGLAKIEDVLSGDDAAKIAEQLGNAEVLRDEVKRLGECFRKHAVDVVKARRKLRYLIGEGHASELKAEVMHRSDECREAFTQAQAFAEAAHTETHCLHLLAALLQKPGVRIAQAVAYAGGDVQALAKGAAEAMEQFAPALAAKPAAQPKSLLAKFGVDLTQLAQDGKIEPLIGRRKEILQIVRTLSRKTKNNPILLGDPGVGKTALVRALALRISQGNAPPPLVGKKVIELSLSTLVAGTKYRGEFEERITRIIEEAKARPEVILFIDEIHTIVGAGSSEGGLDAANMLKPALASSDLRCIGSTTLTEYRKHFEKDAALARRFQPVMVEEPSAEETLEILSGLRERYEQHHNVKIATSALRAAVDLACRYLPDRRLPDKALDLLDEGCARARIGSVSFRGDAEDLLAPIPVTVDTIAMVVSEWTGIPVTRLSVAEQQKFQNMAQSLAKRVIGQQQAVDQVTRIVAMSRGGLRDPRRPVGVFLFIGPTGVGKTELCRALAEFLFGSDQEMIRLDMSEYKDKSSVSRLIGAPPGYIGHDEEGQLTGKLRRKPYSVVLLDEIEKAHPEIFDLFLQLFDEGRLTDSHGRTVDGKNAIYVMTSNAVVSSPDAAKPIGFVAEPDGGPLGSADIRQAMLEDLHRFFRPEFLNRIDEIVTFRPLALADLGVIARQMLARVADSLSARNVSFEFDQGVLDWLAKAGYDPANGARPLARVIDRAISGPLSQRLISGEIQPGDHIVAAARDKGIEFTKGTPQDDSDLTR